MDINITKKQKVGIGVFLLLILVLTSFFYFKNKAQLPKDGIRKNRVLVEETSTKTNLIKADKGSSTDQSSYIKAYICGYVANPGVYTLNQGDRLDDLLRLAGGFTKEADPRGVNLAYLVKDQDYFRILSINETKDSIDNKPGDLSVNSMAGNKINTSSSEDSKDVKININTASKEQLKELPRIGDSMSQRIIDYREKEGGFKTLDDIKEVSGIGEKMFENIKDKITVE